MEKGRYWEEGHATRACDSYVNTVSLYNYVIMVSTTRPRQGSIQQSGDYTKRGIRLQASGLRCVCVSSRIARSPRCGRCTCIPSGSSCRPCSTCRRTGSTAPWCTWRPRQCPDRTMSCARHRRATSLARTAKSRGCARCSRRPKGSTCSRQTRSHRTGPNDSSCEAISGAGSGFDLCACGGLCDECGTRWGQAVRTQGALAVRHALGVLLCAL